MKRGFTSFFPVLKQIQTYSKPELTKDLVAGLTVGVILVPQSMAYALLAGVPPIYGLYAGLIPLLIYAILGTSRQLSVGPVAVSSLLVFAGVSTIADPFSSEYVRLAIITGILAGVLQLSLGILRLGFLVNFLSRPVIAGFSSAAAIIIAISQFKDIFGFPVEGSTCISCFIYTLGHIGETHLLSFTIAITALVLLFLLRYLDRRIPAALLIVILGTILSQYLDWTNQGVAIVGEIPVGLPEALVPNWSWSEIRALIPTILSVGIIGTVECLSIAKLLESKTKDHIVRPNRELIAVGMSKIIGGFFQSMPSSSSFSRSAVNNDMNAFSQVSSIVTAVLIGLTLLFLTPLFEYMPKAVLAAIILQSVVGLFEYEEASYLWKVHRADFTMMVITFLITLVIGIEEGVFAGVILSIIVMLYKSTRPHVVQLGNIPGTSYYRNIDRFDESATSEDVVIFRFDDQLYFGNANYLKEFVRNKIEALPKMPKALLLDASNIHNMDSSGAHALKDIENYLKENNIELHLSGANGPLRDMLYKCGLMTEPSKHHMSVHDGVQAIQGIYSQGSVTAIQQNVDS